MRYLMPDNAIVDTGQATQSWEESTRWDGYNHISRATDSQWEHEALYRGAKGRYYVVWWSHWKGSSPTARYLDAREAASWLAFHRHEIPADLEDAEVTE